MVVQLCVSALCQRGVRQPVYLLEIRKQQLPRELRGAPETIQKIPLAALVGPQPHDVPLVGDT